MPISERDRHDLYLAVERSIGTEQADTMMAMLPPVGWADVATKHDLAELEGRLEARFDTRIDRALRQMVFALVASQATMTALVLTAIGLTR